MPRALEARGCLPLLVKKIDIGSRRLAPNPTSRKDHSDLLQFHFFNQNEIRIELIAERAARRIE
jgi:hypothetical protein